MSFSQALSGLRAQAENIKVISNNIANSQTVGFKSGNVLFADVFAGASSKVGLGVNVAGIMQDFRSGALENTGRNLDLAIAGEGFYRLEKSNGEVVYSRNGEFNQDQNGFLVNGTGQFLTGYGLSNENDPFSEVIPGGAPQRLQIPPNDIPANATTEADAIYNLDASTVVGENTQTAKILTEFGNPESEAEIEFHFSSSFTAFDSLGNERTITSYYEKIGVNEWQASIAIDGVIEGFEPGGGGGGGGGMIGVQSELQDSVGDPAYPVWDGTTFTADGNPELTVDAVTGRIQFTDVQPAPWPLTNQAGDEVYVQQQTDADGNLLFNDDDEPLLVGAPTATEFGIIGEPIVVLGEQSELQDAVGDPAYPVWDGTTFTADGNPELTVDAVTGRIQFTDVQPTPWPLTNQAGDEVYVQQQTNADGNLLFNDDDEPLLVGAPTATEFGVVGEPINGGTEGGGGNSGANSFTVNFDSNGALARDENGNIIGVSQDGDNSDTAVITVPADNLDGAAELIFNLSLDGTTQFNNNSVQNTLNQNGYTSGTLIGIEVQEDGTVVRIYTNEERRDAGQIVLTNFINPEGLQPDGNNAWRQTNASGEPVLGVAGTGIFGTIEGGVLENSNVDLAQQLVDMIVSQRAYQANSSSIGTQDEMLQTIINL